MTATRALATVHDPTGFTSGAGQLRLLAIHAGPYRAAGRVAAKAANQSPLTGVTINQAGFITALAAGPDPQSLFKADQPLFALMALAALHPVSPAIELTMMSVCLNLFAYYKTPRPELLR